MVKVMGVARVLARYEVDPIGLPASDAPPLRFVVDILQRPGESDCFARVHRRESFRFQLPFGSSEFSDDSVLVLDENFAWEDERDPNPDALLNRILSLLQERLGVARS